MNGGPPTSRRWAPVVVSSAPALGPGLVADPQVLTVTWCPAASAHVDENVTVAARSSWSSWLLTKAERANAQTVLDDVHSGERAWSQGKHVRPLVHGATYFAELAQRMRRPHCPRSSRAAEHDQRCGESAAGRGREAASSARRPPPAEAESGRPSHPSRRCRPTANAPPFTSHTGARGEHEQLVDELTLRTDLANAAKEPDRLQAAFSHEGWLPETAASVLQDEGLPTLQ